jgi:hypothetical protein
MPSIEEWLWGSTPELQKKATGTKQQMQFGGQDIISMLQQMMQGGGGLNLANQYDQSFLNGGQEAYNQFAAPYMQQFEEQLLPQIAERFAGGGALSSSGFGQALGGAASGFQANLAQLFSQLQGQAAQRQQGQFQNLSQIGLGYSPFAYHEKAGSVGAMIPLLEAFIKKLPIPGGGGG